MCAFRLNTAVLFSETPLSLFENSKGCRCILVVAFRCMTLMAHAASLTEAFISNGHLVRPRLFACSIKCPENAVLPHSRAPAGRDRGVNEILAARLTQ